MTNESTLSPFEDAGGDPGGATPHLVDHWQVLNVLAHELRRRGARRVAQRAGRALVPPPPESGWDRLRKSVARAGSR